MPASCIRRRFIARTACPRQLYDRSNAYGPREPWQGKRAEVIPRFILQTLSGAPCVLFGDGRQTRDFTYVEDVADGIIAAGGCDQLLGEAVNIARGREISVGRIAELIRTAINPDGVEAVTGQSRPGDVDRHWADVTKAERLIGFTARRSFEDGLRHTIDWFTERHGLGVFADACAGAANW